MFSQITRLIMIVIVIITFTIAQPTITRCCHGSTVANNKIYIGGGVTAGSASNDIWIDDFFLLDLTKPFSTSSPTDMPYEMKANIPVKSGTLVYAKNAKNGMIYLLGGFKQSPQGDPIYGYDLEINEWSSITPKVRDGAVIMPVNFTSRIVGVTDSSLGTIYVFDNGTMFIYDVLNNFWGAGPVLAPFRLDRYAAVMLNTDEIAYIGGSDGIANVPMEQILLYNTKLSLWYIKIARSIDSKIPSPRVGHTASMAPDGRIFIYGGFDGNETAINSSGSTPTFAVLEYVDGEFKWYSPEIFNQSYVMRIFHSSHVVGNYLIIAFGQNLTNSRLNTIDLINIKDRDSYTVVTDFIPENFVPTPTPIISYKKIKINIILISALGTAGFLIIIGGSVILRYYRGRQSVGAIPTAGENYEKSVTNYLPTTPGSISTYTIHNHDITATCVNIYVSNS